MNSVKKISAKTLSLLVALLMLMGMFTVLPGTVSANAATVSRPASISAKALNQTQIKISWSKVNGASGYRIYRSTSKNGGYKRIKTITNASTTSYINKSLVSGKTYYYKIKAYKGSSSSKSTVAATAKTKSSAISKSLLQRKTGKTMIIYEQHDYDGDGYVEAFGVNEYSSSGQYLYFMNRNGVVYNIRTVNPIMWASSFASTSTKAYKVGSKYFFVYQVGSMMGSQLSSQAYGVNGKSFYKVFGSDCQQISVSSNNTIWSLRSRAGTYKYKYSCGRFVLIG